MSLDLTSIFETDKIYGRMALCLLVGPIVFVITFYYYLAAAWVVLTGQIVEGKLTKKYRTYEGRSRNSGEIYTSGITVNFKVGERRYSKPFRVSREYSDRVPLRAPVFLILDPKRPEESAVLAEERVNPILPIISMIASALGFAYFYYRLRWKFPNYA